MTPACGTGGPGFESQRACHSTKLSMSLRYGYGLESGSCLSCWIVGSICSKLFNTEPRANPWKVLGFVGSSMLDLDPNIWTLNLTPEQIDACYDEWEHARSITNWGRSTKQASVAMVRSRMKETPGFNGCDWCNNLYKSEISWSSRLSAVLYTILIGNLQLDSNYALSQVQENERKNW